MSVAFVPYIKTNEGNPSMTMQSVVRYISIIE